MRLSVDFNATNVFVDQPVKMTVIWSSDTPFKRCYDLKFDVPLLRDSNWEVYPQAPGVPEEKRIGLPVNSQRVIAQNQSTNKKYKLKFFFQLVPRYAGTYRTKTRLNCAVLETQGTVNQYPSYFNNHFFNKPEKNEIFKRVDLMAPMPTLIVNVLPETGRNAYYSGIVGDCQAMTFIKPVNAVVGQASLLTVTLTNLLFGRHIQNLPEATLDGIGPEFQIASEPMKIETSQDSMSFTYIVRPLRSSIESVPALVFQIFNPEQQSYRMVRTLPLAITVDPDGENTIYQSFHSQNKKYLISKPGIRNNRKESMSQMNVYQIIEGCARFWWICWLLPPLLWFLLKPLFRHRDRCRTDPAYARAARALQHFRRVVKQDEEFAWITYLADRLNLHAEAVTFETVECELKKRNINPELIQFVRDRFAQQDTMIYGPPGTPAQNLPATSNLVHKLQHAIRLFLFLIFLMPVFNCDATSADEIFNHAIKIRDKKPDEAQILFTEAALKFEAKEAYYNAGNSWFFANENGRALANYLTTEKRIPFNRQLRESIAFIRTQRADRFQSRSGMKIHEEWNSFCRWSPSFRVGLLTLVYLIIWIIYLTACFFGKRIPRRVWFVPGLAAGILLISLGWSSFQPSGGVIIQAAEARLGPGYAYDKAYDTILHKATEFQWLETREGWVHARLPDDNKVWLRSSACVKVR